MATELHITRSRSRRYRCDIAGCRTFTNILVSKRGDLSSRPLHLCEDCIRGLNRILDEQKSARDVATVEESVPDPIPEPEPEAPKHEPESKPNRARKPGAAPKGGGRK